MRILAEETCCVSIDYQERILPAMAGKERLLKQSVKLLTGLRILDIPIILTAQYIKGLGLNVPEITKAAGSTEYMEKTSFSIYGNEAVKQKLFHIRNGASCRNVVICGIETHICVIQSVIDLKAAGYQPILAEDCVSSRNMHDKEIAIARARDEGAVITTCEALLFELMADASNEKFKQISALIK